MARREREAAAAPAAAPGSEPKTFYFRALKNFAARKRGDVGSTTDVDLFKLWKRAECIEELSEKQHDDARADAAKAAASK